MSEEQDDQVYAQLAAKAGGVLPLLEGMFGFLNRRTDFYVEFDPAQSPKASMGFPKGVAERMVLDAFRKYPPKPYEEGLPAPPAATAVNSSSYSASHPLAVPPPLLQMTADGKQVPIGNGGIGPNYYWTQTLRDATVYIDVAEGTRGKDVKCDLRARELKLTVAKDELLVEGTFEDPVRVDESMWTINISSPPQIVITLEKTRNTWWKHVFIGHPEVDTSKVDSTAKISEYDETTQSQIRKIMHEQREKQKRAPYLKEGDVGEEDIVKQVPL
jgi:hypothetical protein